MKAFISIFAILLLTTAVSGKDSNDIEIIEVDNLQVLTRDALNSKKVILLEFSSEHCNYCELLEAEIIRPMILSEDYPDVLIRKLDISRYNTIIDFDGSSSTGHEIANHYNVSLTPTILFLNGKNEEVSKRIIGVNSLDFFGGYVDGALEQGLAKIQ